ncbi:unnamed protein product [Globisporangium polare]
MAREGGYYAIARGRQVGIFATWSEAEAQTKGYSGAKHKKFSTEAEAKAYLAANGASTAVATGGNIISTESKHSVEQSQSAQTDGRAAGKAPVDDLVDQLGFSKLSFNESARIKSEAAQQASPAQEEKPDGATTLVDGLWYYECAAPDPRHEDTLVAFCAGSALGNGKPDCQAAYACLFPHCTEWDVVSRMRDDDRATNMRADYSSALEAMKRANTHDPTNDQALFIFTNNKDLILSMTEWIYKWRVNKWRNSEGKPVENRDLLEQLLAEQGQRRILWRHTGLPVWESKWHKKASRAAQSAAA